jgi:hypothetical protein
MFNLDEYTTVAERIKIFRQMFPMGRIITFLVHESVDRVVFKCELYRDDQDQFPFSTGYARELTAERGVNRDFALENCETSAIGIAAKNADIGTEKKSISREEAAKVNRVKERDALIQETKAKMAETAKEYVPVPVEDDVWTIKDRVPVTTLDDAVAMVKSELGGTTETDIQRCKHGEMIWKTGTGKNGKQWAHFRCPQQGHPMSDPCDPIWYEVGSDGKWKQQVKR